MVSEIVKVINEQGIHMRPAGILAKEASSEKECKVTLKANGKTINGGAVMQIMAAGLKNGSEVEIICEGKGEKELLERIVRLFREGFGE